MPPATANCSTPCLRNCCTGTGARPDLTTYLGRGLRSLPDDEGAALLEALGIGSHAGGREQVSHQFDGHPLALRFFARSMPPITAATRHASGR